MKKVNTFLPVLILVITSCQLLCANPQPESKKPNIVFILVDQWRAQATGYSGDKNVKTPNIDRLASSSMNLKNAVSGMPVCSPFRASLMTGQYPLTHGLFMNDIMLDTAKTTIAEVYLKHGYSTGFIGKWHIDGHGRSSFIPKNRRQGFQYWKALECTHDYNRSAYYFADSDKKLFWDGYDVIDQSNDAREYISEQSKSTKPFALFISMGPPHDPYQSAPEMYRKIYDDNEIQVNANVPEEFRDKVKRDLKGYYSHITAIDDYIGKIWQTIKDAGIEDNSIIVFTADHGDLLGAHGSWNKQQPYEESIRVPFLIHYPAVFGNEGKTSPVLLNSPDIMPTLLGLSNIQIPKSVEGTDFSGVLTGNKKDKVEYTLISCVQPFGQWTRKRGGKEFRGIVTTRYTYVKDLSGPWLLFDNEKDPFQLNNLIGNDNYATIEKKLEKQLRESLKVRKDEFMPGLEYVKKWNYVLDETETIPYNKINYAGKPIIE